MINESNQPPQMRAVVEKNKYAALGRAVSYLMTKPAFARAPFGHWARTLTGQINRDHYFMVMRGEKVVGFLGWALVPEEKAAAWAEGRAEIAFDDSRNGDCIVINAWSAEDADAHQFIREKLREVGKNAKKLYGKRFYKDGRTRAVVLNVNDFVDRHISAQSKRSTS